MLLVKYSKLNISTFIDKYNDKIKLLEPNKCDLPISKWLVDFIGQVRFEISNNDVVVVNCFKELILSLKALNIQFKLLCPMEIDQKDIESNKVECDIFRDAMVSAVNESNDDLVVIKDISDLEKYLKSYFDWISIDNAEEDDATNELTAMANNLQQPTNLTLKDIISDDVKITESDLRELKSLTNKFKVAMLLQAKSRLSTVLKLCDVLDKLYAELVTRIDTSLATTDTASLMYTADYISKALNDTNQFIMSLVTSEKLQNFFIIDNSSSIINISDDRVDINKREKIRKAAEIVIDNIDYFTQGDFSKIVNPNEVSIEDIEEDTNDADTST